MKGYTYNEIRKKYIDFMVKNGHKEIPSAPLVPEDDPTVLFVNAGMFPLVPFLLGEAHPSGTRLTDLQRCLRTIDIDSVGDSTHCTTFEMLGNWSLNDYFKETAINLTLHFFLEELGFDISQIYASVFAGNENAPEDNKSIEVWKEIYHNLGIEAKVGPGERIQPLGAKENWWELPEGGPCGPCSEIFYDTGKEKCSETCGVDCDCGKYVELGNNVFMEYLKKDGTYSKMERHNVDFGGGLDRLAMISQGLDSVFETEKYAPIIEKVREIGRFENIRAERIITDHIKAATWIIMDGIKPGRTEREYILRRLIRRAIRQGKQIGIKGNFTGEVADIAIEQFKDIWPLLEDNKDMIINVLDEEETKFNETIEKGLKEFDKLLDETLSNDTREFDNSTGFTFKMYETYGFPLEMSLEELDVRGIDFDKEKVMKEHQYAYEKHQEMSRTASKGLFKGGLADTSDETKRLHTATHLLLKALQTVLGGHVYQKGSNITPERLRLDFPNDSKLTPEQVIEVENLVNQQIEKQLPVTWVEMPKDKALELVPFAAFEDKYSDTVKVYTVGEDGSHFSKEICNGPHVENTKELGRFKITKQENVGSGIKRIKAILE